MRITVVVVDPVWAIKVVRTVVVVLRTIVVVVGTVVVIKLTVVVVIWTGFVRRNGRWLWCLNRRKHLGIDWNAVGQSQYHQGTNGGTNQWICDYFFHVCTPVS